MSEKYHLIAKIRQRPGESVVRTLDVSNWGSGPTSPALTIYEIENNVSTDVTNTKKTGTSTVNGDVITAAAVHSLTDGKKYQVVLTFDLGSSTLQAYWDVSCNDDRPDDAA